MEKDEEIKEQNPYQVSLTNSHSSSYFSDNEALAKRKSMAEKRTL